MNTLTDEILAFEKSYRGFTVKAFWGNEPTARIEITKDDKPYKTFDYPSYRIFNIAAHFEDMIDDELTADPLKP